MTRSPIGNDWLQDFRDKFSEEFPEQPKTPIESIAQRAVEANVAAERKQVARPGRDA